MSATTARVYVMVARAIKATDMDGIDRSLLIDKLCVEFSSDNPHFDRDRFTKACTPKVEPLRLVEDDHQGSDESVGSDSRCPCVRCSPWKD